MHDGCRTESAVTKGLATHQTNNIVNTDYTCLQHGLAAEGKGIQTVMKQNRDENEMVYYRKGIFNCLEICCKVFGKSGNYNSQCNKRESLDAFCDNKNLTNYFANLGKYPSTRIHQVFGLSVLWIQNVETIKSWVLNRSHILNDCYKNDILSFVRCKYTLIEGFLLSLWYCAHFQLIQRHYINHNVNFKTASKHFLTTHKKFVALYNGDCFASINMIVCGVTRIDLDYKNYGFVSDHTFIQIINKSSTQALTKAESVVLKKFKRICQLRIIIACIVTFLNENEGQFCIVELLQILMKDHLFNWQTNDRCIYEKTIIQQDGYLQLAQKYYQLSKLFTQSLAGAINESTKRCQNLVKQGCLSQDNQAKNPNNRNVPAVNDVAESIIGQFKYMAAKMENAKHTTIEGIVCFRRNATYHWFKQMEQSDLEQFKRIVAQIMNKPVRQKYKEHKQHEKSLKKRIYEKEEEMNQHKDESIITTVARQSNIANNENWNHNNNTDTEFVCVKIPPKKRQKLMKIENAR